MLTVQVLKKRATFADKYILLQLQRGILTFALKHLSFWNRLWLFLSIVLSLLEFVGISLLATYLLCLCLYGKLCNIVLWVATVAQHLTLQTILAPHSTPYQLMPICIRLLLKFTESFSDVVWYTSLGNLKLTIRIFRPASDNCRRWIKSPSKPSDS